VSGKGDTYHIGSIGSFAGNLGGRVGGNVSGTSTQNIRQELEKVAALVGQLRQYHGQMGLGAQRQAEVSRDVDAIDEEMRASKPKPSVIGGLLESIKSTMEGAAGNLRRVRHLEHQPVGPPYSFNLEDVLRMDRMPSRPSGSRLLRGKRAMAASCSRSTMVLTSSIARTALF
jgi:hypothetical protein